MDLFDQFINPATSKQPVVARIIGGPTLTRLSPDAASEQLQQLQQLSGVQSAGQGEPRQVHIAACQPGFAVIFGSPKTHNHDSNSNDSSNNTNNNTHNNNSDNNSNY